MFTGTVIARKGSGLSETFSVHRVAYGEGMERVFHAAQPPYCENRSDERRAMCAAASFTTCVELQVRKQKLKGASAPAKSLPYNPQKLLKARKKLLPAKKNRVSDVPNEAWVVSTPRIRVSLIA